MSKQNVIKIKYLPPKSPLILTAVSYLLFRDINPEGVFRGVLLTVFIGLVLLCWVVYIVMLFKVKPRNPAFEVSNNER